MATPQLSVTKTETKDFVILKIPRILWQAQKEDIVSLEEKKAIEEGMKAMKEGRISKGFTTTKSAIAFLRSL